MSTVTFMHRLEDVEALERRLVEEVLTANLSNTKVTSVDGRFQVLRVLDHGASSVVCEALDTKLNRRVALKLFPGLADDRLARGVKREAQGLAGLTHPNIVIVHDYDVLKLMPGEHRCFYVAMELGVPLKKWLETAPRTYEEILATFGRVGEGLAAIHVAGFVYRDFKPGNVVLVAGVPKIVDFGLALSAAAGGDATQARVGTPAFMSPEALAGRPQDARSDQFSFAAALWKALCGALPYDPASDDPEQRRPLHPPKVPLPEPLLETLRRALDPVPERRFTDMPALLAALPLTEPVRGSAATGVAPALGLDIDSTTEMVPVRRSARRSVAPWLAVPVVGVLSGGGVLTYAGFWDTPRAAEEEAPVREEIEETEIPAAPIPAPDAACPAVDAMTGAWNFSAAAEWAEQAGHLGRVGRYTLELSRDDSPCGLWVDLHKLGNDGIVYSEPRSDRQRVQVAWAKPFTGGFAGQFTPRKAREATGDHTYAFAFIVDGDRLYGDFHAEAAGGKQRFSGVVRGARPTVKDVSPDGPLPCTTLCGARCLGTEATAECRQACTADTWGEHTCPAPDPTTKIGLPAKTGACSDAKGYAGRWLLLARDRASQEQRAYEVELRAAGCDLVASARDRERAEPFDGKGRVDASGVWQLELTSGRSSRERVRHTWSLVGRDPAFGEFTARHGDEQLAAGVLAAYRHP